MKKPSALRGVACLVPIVLCLLGGGCGPVDGSAPGTAYRTAESRQKAHQFFMHVDTHRALPAAYPARGERQAEYARIESEWNGIKGKYANTAFSYEFFDTFPQDAKPVFVGLAAIKRRADASSGTTVPTGAAGRRGEGVTVPPYSMIQWQTKGNCLDPDLPAPRAGDTFQLVPVSTVIHPDLVPLYQCVIRQAQTDAQARKHQQQLVWALRTAGASRSYAASLKAEHRAVLNRCDPSAVAAFDRVRLTQDASVQIGGLLRDIVPGVSISVLGFNPLDLLTADDPAVYVEQQVGRLIGMPVNELVQDDSDYQYGMIAEGVYTHVKGTGPLAVDIRLVNATAVPFVFDPTLYAAQAQRKTQRVSLATPPSGRTKVTRLSARNDTQRGMNEDKAFLNKTLTSVTAFWRSYAPKAVREDLEKGWKTELVPTRPAQAWLGTHPFIAAVQSRIELQSERTLGGEDLTQAASLSLKTGFSRPFAGKEDILPHQFAP